MFVKRYPYLQDISFDSYDTKAQKRKFLSSLCDYPIQDKYVRIILLDWKENPIREIQGEITGGTLSKDANSTCRRSCSITTSFNANEYDVEDIESAYSIKNKVFVEIGIKNNTELYTDYPILWFPQGIFVIQSFSFSSSTTTAINATIQLRDKMSLLNGDCGGKFQSTIVLDSEDTQIKTGEYNSQKIPIYRIIQELVNHFGNETLDNIIIEDIPQYAQQIMKWTGSNPLYLLRQGSETAIDAYVPQLNEPTGGDYLTITAGLDAGYVVTELVYPGELTANAGETVTSVLDKIKQTLGNYEYFYDEFGRFHFREMRNYINTSQSSLILNEVNARNDETSLGTPAAYLVDVSYPKSDYSFENDELVVSINNTPKYDNIKNDYVVHGKQKSDSSNTAFDIFYHLVIDKKPELRPHTDIVFYKDPDSEHFKARKPFWVSALPTVGDFNLIYMIGNKNRIYKSDISIAYYWDGSEYIEIPNTDLEYYGIYYNNSNEAPIEKPYFPVDWRTELYLRGVEISNLGLSAAQELGEADAEFYFPELDAFWPTIYDLRAQQFYGVDSESGIARAEILTRGFYFLDFIDSASTALGQYGISNIGRRSDVISEDSINCLFTPEIPNINFINIDEDDFIDQVKDCMRKGLPYAQVRGDIFNTLQMGGTKSGAYDKIKYELYYHTNYQRTLTVTAYPMYYLEPNTRITINSKSTNTYGDFMIQSISIPLGATGTISITMNETTDRFE